MCGNGGRTATYSCVFLGRPLPALVGGGVEDGSLNASHETPNALARATTVGQVASLRPCSKCEMVRCERPAAIPSCRWLIPDSSRNSFKRVANRVDSIATTLREKLGKNTKPGLATLRPTMVYSYPSANHCSRG